jgi:hypothetical protein
MTQIKPNRQVGQCEIDLLLALIKTAEGGAMEGKESIVLRLFWADQIEKLRMKMARQMVKHLESIGQTAGITTRQMADCFDLRKIATLLTTELMADIIESEYGIKLTSSNRSVKVGA